MEDELLEKGREIQDAAVAADEAGRTGAVPRRQAGAGLLPLRRRDGLRDDLVAARACPSATAAWSRSPSSPPSARPTSCAPTWPARSTSASAREELVEVLMQTAVYAGVPAANEALRVAADVLGTDDAAETLKEK